MITGSKKVTGKALKDKDLEIYVSKTGRTLYASKVDPLQRVEEEWAATP